MWTKDPARKEAQGRLHSINNDRVSRVVSTLEANDPVSAFGKYINDLSLTFITPLSANDHNARHTFSSRDFTLVFTTSSYTEVAQRAAYFCPGYRPKFIATSSSPEPRTFNKPIVSRSSMLA
jgi:hypothetical protein